MMFSENIDLDKILVLSREVLNARIEMLTGSLMPNPANLVGFSNI